MKQLPEHGSYYDSNAEQYTFYSFPKALFTNKCYKSISDSLQIPEESRRFKRRDLCLHFKRNTKAGAD